MRTLAFCERLTRGSFGHERNLEASCHAERAVQGHGLERLWCFGEVPRLDWELLAQSSVTANNIPWLMRT